LYYQFDITAATKITTNLSILAAISGLAMDFFVPDGPGAVLVEVLDAL
jgi:hypothetical protein